MKLDVFVRERTASSEHIQGNEIILRRNEIAYSFSFSRVFRHDTDIEEIYSETISKKKGLLFYGQTSSGKTHTCNQIIERLKNEIVFPIKWIVTEIYLDKVERRETNCSSKEELDSEIERWRKTRHTGATKMNDKSSRSHCVLQIGKIWLVDLAGSESLKLTESEGQRAKEGVSTNSGLLSLGRIIRLLSEKASFIPYREHPLTWILKSVLPQCNILITINSDYPAETISSLRFGSDAKKVEFVVPVTEHKEEEVVSETESFQEMLLGLIEEKDRIIATLEEKIDMLLRSDSE